MYATLKKNYFMIRFFDIVFSLTSLIVLSPLLLLICVVLKFTGEGEVFYLQKRVGLGLSFIKIYKFATMKKNSEFIGTGTLTVKNDPRILPLGNFLRNTKIKRTSSVTEYFERRHEHHWSKASNRRIFLDVSRKFN